MAPSSGEGGWGGSKSPAISKATSAPPPLVSRWVSALLTSIHPVPISCATSLTLRSTHGSLLYAYKCALRWRGGGGLPPQQFSPGHPAGNLLGATLSPKSAAAGGGARATYSYPAGTLCSDSSQGGSSGGTYPPRWGVGGGNQEDSTLPAPPLWPPTQTPLGGGGRRKNLHVENWVATTPGGCTRRRVGYTPGLAACTLASVFSGAGGAGGIVAELVADPLQEGGLSSSSSSSPTSSSFTRASTRAALGAALEDALHVDFSFAAGVRTVSDMLCGGLRALKANARVCRAWRCRTSE